MEELKNFLNSLDWHYSNDFLIKNCWLTTTLSTTIEISENKDLMIKYFGAWFMPICAHFSF